MHDQSQRTFLVNERKYCENLDHWRNFADISSIIHSSMPRHIFLVVLGLLRNLKNVSDRQSISFG